MEYTKITENTIQLLKMTAYDWIAKDKDNEIGGYTSKPIKDYYNWYNDKPYIVIYANEYKDVNFDFLSWDDKEPTYIPDLLKGVLDEKE